VAAPRRGCLGIFLAYCALLALAEYATVTMVVLPLPSTRFDWYLATAGIAPFGALVILWTAAFIARIIADLLALCAWTARHVTGARK
jgi:hypothetical protein